MTFPFRHMMIMISTSLRILVLRLMLLLLLLLQQQLLLLAAAGAASIMHDIEMNRIVNMHGTLL